MMANAELTGTTGYGALAARRMMDLCAGRPGRHASACPVERPVRPRCWAMACAYLLEPHRRCQSRAARRTGAVFAGAAMSSAACTAVAERANPFEGGAPVQLTFIGCSHTERQMVPARLVW